MDCGRERGCDGYVYSYLCFVVVLVRDFNNYCYCEEYDCLEDFDSDFELCCM